MRVFTYNEPVFDEQGKLINNVTVKKTEQEVLNEYWLFWKDQVIRVHGEDSDLITEENCIQDWVVVNWAWEYEENS